MVSSQILQFDRYPLSSLSEIRRPAAFVIALVRFNPTAKIIVFLSPDQVFTIHGITPRDVLARRVPVSAFCRYRVSLQRKKCCQQIIGLNDESFPVAVCSKRARFNFQSSSRITRSIVLFAPSSFPSARVANNH